MWVGEADRVDAERIWAPEPDLLPMRHHRHRSEAQRRRGGQIRGSGPLPGAMIWPYAGICRVESGVGLTRNLGPARPQTHESFRRVSILNKFRGCFLTAKRQVLGKN